MSTQTKIILVDDHTIVRKGLKELIERMGPYIVTTEYDNGRQLLDAIPFSHHPDLIILDLSMPVLNGLETVRELKERGHEYPILILTIDTNEKNIIELFRLGVRGYLPKNCTADMMKKAIDDIERTGYFHNEWLVKALQAESANNKEDERQKVLKQITDRENIFLKLVCDEEEYTYEQMADILKVHRRTIDGYRESLFDKFNIKSKTGLVLFAIRYGLIEIPLKY